MQRITGIRVNGKGRVNFLIDWKLTPEDPLPEKKAFTAGLQPALKFPWATVCPFEAKWKAMESPLAATMLLGVNFNPPEPTSTVCVL